MRINPLQIALLMGALSVTTAESVGAQVGTEVPPVVAGARAVTLQRVKVHSPAIAGNREGEAADRDVIVVLPPGYGKDLKRRYPVVYALHGYSINPEQWIKEIHVPQTVEGAFAKGAGEMSVVFPDGKTAYDGSMYSSSATSGDFERFVIHDVLDSYAIANSFDFYKGTHTSAVAFRFQDFVLAFFARNLSFEPKR